MARETTRYDVAEHLRTPKEMAAYLEARLVLTPSVNRRKGYSSFARAGPFTGISMQSSPKIRLPL